jgi:hypothetical protein
MASLSTIPRRGAAAGPGSEDWLARNWFRFRSGVQPAAVITKVQALLFYAFDGPDLSTPKPLETSA